MSGWPIAPLGSIVKFISGGTPSKDEKRFWEGDIPWVSSAEMTQRWISDTRLRVTEAGAIEGSKRVPKNTVLVVVRGMSLAKEFRVSISQCDVTFNQDVKAVLPSKVIDPVFLFFYLLSQSNAIRDSASEAAHGTKKLDMPVLEQWPIPIPPLPIQKKIAAVLSTYDDLIANNQHRITLLEKMAEDIYREWFVRLRPPEQDELKTEKGVPLGWRQVSIGSLGSYLNGYAFDPTEWFSEGVPIIKIREMTSGVTVDTPRNPGESIQKRYHFDNGDIIFSWSATLLVKVWDQGPGLLNQHLFKVTPNQGIPKSFLFFSLNFSLPIFEALTTGSTMKHIKRKELETVKVLLPPPALLEKFDSIAAPLLKQMLDLTRANRNLATTRDALLPRLISGKLAVDELDIRFPPQMAGAQKTI
jgi:type I restriction enzyme, S subunit